MNASREPRIFGHLPMPAWHRPHFRYIINPEDGSAAGADDENDADKTDQTDDAGNGNGTDDDAPVAGQEALGDAGKQALDRMKADRNAARAAERDAKAALAALEAQVAGKQAEHQQELEKQRIKDEALAAANLRIKKAEIRAIAAGKLSDPTDALNFIDLDGIDVDDEGNVDTTAVTAALDDLLTKKPYLAAQGGSRFQGKGDGGARTGDRKPPQLTEADVDRLTAEGRHAEIVKAKAEGRLEDYLKS